MMKNVLLKNQLVDQLTLEWIGPATPQEVLFMSQKWLSDQNFLTERLGDVKKVGESSFTIEPLESGI